MKETKAGVILENAARLAGRGVAQLGIPDNWRVLAAMSVNAGLTRIVAEKFPMMTRTEFRRYRPTWDPEAGYRIGNEVWWGESYWRLVEADAGEPGVAACWMRLEPGEVVAFVAWDQPWENTVIHRAGADPARFAYAADPKYNPEATPLRAARVTSFGIELEAPAPDGVWCRFIPETPPLSFVEWSAATEYDPGDVAYLTATKEAYVCLAHVQQGDPAPNAPGNDAWFPVRIPGEFEAYLTRLVAADLQTLDQGKAQTQAQAEAEFERLCEFYHEGSGETRVRRGRFV